MVMASQPREAPRFLNIMAKKKSEPAQRIRQLMESLQGGGAGASNTRKRQPEPAAAGQPQGTPIVATITDAGGAAGGLAGGAKVDGAAAAAAASEVAERRKRGMNRPQLSNDGMHAIDDEGDDEQEEVRGCWLGFCSTAAAARVGF